MPVAVARNCDGYNFLCVARGTKMESIYYLGCQWWKLENFAPLPALTDNFSLIVVDGRLYLSTDKSYTSGDDFYRYEAEENKWIPLQPMIKKKGFYDACHLVYLDGFIYFINKRTEHMERYDVSLNRWEEVQPIPGEAFSAVAFKGRIFASVFVCAHHDNPAHYELLIYNPSKDMWQRSDVCEGNNPTDRNMYMHSAKRFLFIHEEQCYRVDMQSVQGSESGTVTVNALDVQVCDDGKVECTIKDEIKQDPKPAGRYTFRIHDKVFVYAMYATGNSVYKFKLMKETPDHNIRITSNIVMFTFDRHKIHKI